VDGEEEEEAAFDDEENSMCEIYFQPKFQDFVDKDRAFIVRCAIDIL